jgi:enamine deaminase RidA (YjgF/YER057c/UK114 family)
MRARQHNSTGAAAVSRRSIVASAAAAAASAGLIASASGQSAPGGKSASHLRFVQPETIFKTTTYTHVVEIMGPGRLIYTSGEQGREPDGNFPPDIRGQSVRAFENIKAALAAVGATFDHVVKLNVYMIDLRKNQPTFSEVKQQYVNKLAPPASTTVGVPQLTREGALVEVEAVAALPVAG